MSQPLMMTPSDPVVYDATAGRSAAEPVTADRAAEETNATRA